VGFLRRRRRLGERGRFFGRRNRIILLTIGSSFGALVELILHRDPVKLEIFLAFLLGRNLRDDLGRSAPRVCSWKMRFLRDVFVLRSLVLSARAIVDRHHHPGNWWPLENQSIHRPFNS